LAVVFACWWTSEPRDVRDLGSAAPAKEITLPTHVASKSFIAIADGLLGEERVLVFEAVWEYAAVCWVLAEAQYHRVLSF